VTGNLQPGIVKVSASGVQTSLPPLALLTSQPKHSRLIEQATCLSAFDQTSPVLASTIFKFTRMESRARLVASWAEFRYRRLTPQAISLPRTPLIKPSSSLRRQAHRLFLPAWQLSQASNFPSVSL
jgi:hypothetical protein